MKMITSVESAEKFIKELIVSYDAYLGDGEGDANAVAVDVAKHLFRDVEGYRNYLLTMRGLAVQALVELGIPNDYADQSPDIGS